MSNGTDYENPKMELIVFDEKEIILTSLTNGGSGTGGSGGLPTETNEIEPQFL